MPQFGTALTGLNSPRKLTHDELVRTIRYMVAAEYEAVQIYMQVAESTDNVLARKVLKDVSDEERVHAGEFLRLLKELAPDEEECYRQGYEEVEEMMKETAKETAGHHEARKRRLRKATKIPSQLPW